MRLTSGKLYDTIPEWRKEIVMNFEDDQFRDTASVIKHGVRALKPKRAIDGEIINGYVRGEVTMIAEAMNEQKKRWYEYEKLGNKKLFKVLRRLPKARFNTDFDGYYKQFIEALAELLNKQKHKQGNRGIQSMYKDMMSKQGGDDMDKAVKFFNQLTDMLEAEGEDSELDEGDDDILMDSCSSGSGHGEKLDFNKYMQKIGKLADQLSAKDLLVYELSRKFSVSLHRRKGKEYENCLFPADSITVTTGRDILKVTPLSHAMYDDDTFFLKFFRGELLHRVNQQERGHKQILYLLLDVSGSMEGMPEVYATAVALAVLENSIKNEDIYYLRPFDDGVFDLHKAENAEEGKTLKKVLLTTSFDGGGTEIEDALNTAMSDIVSAKESGKLISKAEILLITDGQDRVDENLMREKLEKSQVIVHSVLIGSSSDSLRKISKTYLEAVPDEEHGLSLMEKLSY